jgi:DNA-binding HxlR family transcriptional regulator
MQKIKRQILTCLKYRGVSDPSALRQYFKNTSKPTNPSVLIQHLDVLENVDCIKKVDEKYAITRKGTELLDLLNRINDILS